MSSPVHAVTQETGRFYVHPFSNERFWSVSTICKALAKPFLVPWAAKLAGECAAKEWEYLSTLKAPDKIQRIKSASTRVVGRSSAKGSQVHDLIEAFIRNPDVNPKSVQAHADLKKWNDANPDDAIRFAEILPYFHGFTEWADHFDVRFLYSETTIWNRKEHYAGTLDILAEIPQFGVSIADAKSGNAIYPEVGLQLSAYARGEFYLAEDGKETPLPTPEAAFALHVTSSGTKMIPVKIEDDVYNSFLYIREAFRFMEVISKTVLGPEITVPVKQEA